MLVSSFNLNTLFVMLKSDSVFNSKYESNGDVTRIFRENETIGFNFKNLSDFENGPVFLNEKQISTLNKKIKDAGFGDTLKMDGGIKFEIGEVIKVEEHPDSDHMHVVTVNLGDEKRALVSGSPNMTVGIKVVVVNPGAILPSGQIIWPGSLRGVESNGMIASAKELNLKNASSKPGALILPSDFAEIGTEFDFEKGNLL